MPMLMLATYSLIKNDIKIKKWFKRLAVRLLLLLFLFRIYLALDVIPNVGYTKITFYNREAHALEIKELAQGKKVGFFDNYAAISNYIFYTGDSAVHFQLRITVLTSTIYGTRKNMPKVNRFLQCSRNI
jgi:hypothetical protein